MLVARAPQSLLDGFPVRNVARDRSDVHFQSSVAVFRRAPRVRGLVAQNPLSYCVELGVIIVELLVPAWKSNFSAPRRRRGVVLEGDIHTESYVRWRTGSPAAAENHLCPSCLLEHWTYVLTKYNSRFGLRFLDLPATLALLDAKARGEVAVGV